MYGVKGTDARRTTPGVVDFSNPESSRKRTARSETPRLRSSLRLMRPLWRRANAAIWASTDELMGVGRELTMSTSIGVDKYGTEGEAVDREGQLATR
jgi:hypothetical protein